MLQRLQKVLASAGVASRRTCEALIAEGRVKVNGKRVTEMGIKVDPLVDKILLNGKPLQSVRDHVYIALNKPTGYVCSVSDPHADRTIMDLVKGMTERIYPVGRLDEDSAGLLIMTNDGDFTQKMTHPSHRVPKRYRVLTRGEMSEFAATDLRAGVILEDGMTAPAEVEWVGYSHEHNVTTVDITIHEGRNRQVRRMMESVGYPVLALTRMSIGPLELKGIAPGTWRKLRANEIKELMEMAEPQAVDAEVAEAEEIVKKKAHAETILFPTDEEARETVVPPSRPVRRPQEPKAKRPYEARPRPPESLPTGAARPKPFAKSKSEPAETQDKPAKGRRPGLAPDQRPSRRAHDSPDERKDHRPDRRPNYGDDKRPDKGASARPERPRPGPAAKPKPPVKPTAEQRRKAALRDAAQELNDRLRRAPDHEEERPTYNPKNPRGGSKPPKRKGP